MLKYQATRARAQIITAVAAFISAGAATATPQAPSANGPVSIRGTATGQRPIDPLQEPDAQDDPRTTTPAVRSPNEHNAPSGLTAGANPKLIVGPASISPAAPAVNPSNRAANSPSETRPLGAAPSAIAGVANAQPRDPSTTSGAGTWLGGLGEVSRMVVALVVVIGTIVLARILLKRLGPLVMNGASRPSGVVEVLARFPLARGQHLLLIKLARRVLLVHHAGANMTALSEVTDPDEVASLLGRLEAGASGRDAAKFKQVLRGFEEDHDQLPEVRTIRSTPSSRLGRTAMGDGGEIIDLTRTHSRAFAGLSARKALR